MSTILVYNDDFKSLPAETFAGCDHLITDPPYSGWTHSKAVSIGGRCGYGGPRARDFGFDALTPEDREATCRFAKRIPRWSIIFSDFAKGADAFEGDPELMAQAGHCVIEGDCAWRFQMVHCGGLEWIRLVPWIRWSQPQITGDRPCTGAEAVLHFHPKGRKRWNGPGGLTHYSRKSLRGDDKHPTEKPLDLMLDLVCFFTEPGEAIVDLFAGRGTTGQAARILGRDAVLVEKNPAEAELANTRCESTLSDRDKRALKNWIDTTRAEVADTLADKSTTEPARERALFRQADTDRAAGFL